MCMFAASFIAISGCSKDELLVADATVVDTGPFATGGCELAILTNTGYYEPHNLPADPQFRSDGAKIRITYRVLQNTADCPNAQNFQGLIHLNRVELR